MDFLGKIKLRAYNNILNYFCINMFYIRVKIIYTVVKLCSL